MDRHPYTQTPVAPQPSLGASPDANRCDSDNNADVGRRVGESGSACDRGVHRAVRAASERADGHADPRGTTLASHLRQLGVLAEPGYSSPRARALLHYVVALLGEAAEASGLPTVQLAPEDSTTLHLRALGRLAELSFGTKIAVPARLSEQLDVAIGELLEETSRDNPDLQRVRTELRGDAPLAAPLEGTSVQRWRRFIRWASR